uniref:GH18 domain-containing protein n=1 Tax=Arundo donax TaxID=35708 RepID=A0A0A9FMQ9_ARUDO
MASSAVATRASTRTVLLSIAVALSLSLAASAPAAAPPDAHEAAPASTTTTVRAGYYLAADARLRPLAALDASLYTHLYYSALAVDPTRRAPAVPTDPEQARLLATFSWALKSKNRALRTLLSVGAASGIATGAETDPAFAAMAADPESRASFAAAAVALARANGFDGVDVAWRFPASSVEMADFGFLVSVWRATAPPGFLLTATVYFSDHVFAAPLPGVDYPSEAVAASLDWVNVAAFGLRSPGAAGNATAFDAPLYDRASHFSASYGVVSWVDAGVPASKIVMGLPLYGRSWFLRNKANDGVGAPVVAAGPKQRGSNVTGVMSYAEIQRLAAAGGGGGQRVAVTTTYDNASVASYLSVGDVWVAFDGAAVVAEKLAFAVRRGLLGYFLWPVNYDDANLTVSREGQSVRATVPLPCQC